MLALILVRRFVNIISFGRPAYSGVFSGAVHQQFYPVNLNRMHLAVHEPNINRTDSSQLA
jgi:hypothetical protein